MQTIAGNRGFSSTTSKITRTTDEILTVDPMLMIVGGLQQSAINESAHTTAAGYSPFLTEDMGRRAYITILAPANTPSC